MGELIRVLFVCYVRSIRVTQRELESFGCLSRAVIQRIKAVVAATTAARSAPKAREIGRKTCERP